MGKYNVRVEASDGEYKDAFNLLITINDDCYDAPCGNNSCVDMFNSYVCKCRSGFVGESCDPDYINRVQAVSAENNTLSNATMVGIVIGVIILMMIIIILLVLVFRRPNNKTSDATVENSVVNPLFMKPNDTYNNATYSYTNNSSSNQYFYSSNFATFSKNSDICSIKIYYLRVEYLVIPTTSGTNTFPKMTFIFDIFGIDDYKTNDVSRRIKI
jgi:hypothetical protein